MLFTAIAEAAATAAPETVAAVEAAATAAPEAAAAAAPATSINSMFTTFFIVVGIWFLFAGVSSFLNGKLYGGGRSFDQYTEASCRAYSKPYGVCCFLCGIGLILDGAFDYMKITGWISWIASGVFIIAGLVVMAVYWKRLVKKPGA